MNFSVKRFTSFVSSKIFDIVVRVLYSSKMSDSLVMKYDLPIPVPPKKFIQICHTTGLPVILRFTCHAQCLNSVSKIS